jgi:2-polyprenyl-3-methyl-5-hydroxy-6-metoxy-1,4-benzoquinol methylase
MISTKCAVCETLSNSKIIYKSTIDENSFSSDVFSARRFPDRRYNQWVRCNKCKLLRSDPIKDINFNELYVDSKFNYHSEINGLKKTYLKVLKRALGKNYRKNSLFEVGGGNGFFLEAAKDIGFNIVKGIEPSKSAVEAARHDIKPIMVVSMMQANILDSNSYQVGVMFHVLDHLPDPVLILRDCCEALESKGKFIVAIHNELAWSARLLGKKSPIIDVEHTYLFSKKSAEALFIKAGFIDVKSRSYSNYYSLNYILQLVPFFTNIRKWILQSSFSFILTKLKIRVPLGNIWVCGTKP